MIDKNLTDRDAAWRRQLRDQLTPVQRRQRPRVKMPEADPTERVHSNVEVQSGLTAEQAHQEATRCLDCPQPGCVTGCPVAIDIPAFIKNLQDGRLQDAAAVIGATSALPAVCGRVCPQEKQCESRCIYGKMRLPAVAIGYLERYVADHAKAADNADEAPTAPNGMAVAVIGSGPSGLSFAGQMAAKGYQVTVFEALHEIGGVLKYGIPEFRLPNDVVDREIDALRRAGVQFITDVVVGKTISYDELTDPQGPWHVQGVFVGSGAGLPRFMGIPGENLIGVMSSNEYLTRVNLMGAGRPGYATPVAQGRIVAVVGGGNTAMDSVRTALRMGADRAMIVYRRSREEMPARHEEVEHAMQEGVEFMTLHNPVEYLGDDRGHVRAMRLQRMVLGEPDASGRRSPVPVEGDVTEVPVDMVIVSVGVSPNPLIPHAFQGLEVSRRGTVVTDDGLHTSLAPVWAGGDIVRGGATVILAMGDGRHAAQEMDRHLRGSKD